MAGTIFERNGGFVTIRKVVSSFYDRVLDSDVISHHFADANMRRLIEHQTQFITFLMDGPGVSYSDETLRRVHARLGVTQPEFEEMVALLVETLEDHDFDTTDVSAIERRIRSRQPVIVEPLPQR